MKNKEYWITQLGLEAHPEGGYFAETYRSKRTINLEELEGERNLSTGIYFLIDQGAFSAFHKIKSDEMWHFYDGDPLIVHMIDEKGNCTQQTIGRSIESGEVLQFVVPANVWFASEVKGSGDYSLVGCTVSPGFDFGDFELADRTLIDKFPHHAELLSRLMH